jgi:hypothetical protein
MNTQDQLKALQQILETLNIAASRQTDIDFKKDGNKHFTTAIQNTKKLMNVVEENINYENDLSDMFAGCASLSLNNMD